MTRDLFTPPPFDPDQYIIERNQDLMVKYPESAPELQAQIDRIHAARAKGESLMNPLKKKFNEADTAGQLAILGVKSGKAGKILTEAEDKAKKASRFAEDNIVGAWAKWFKTTYPGVPYVIDRKAQSKSKLRSTIERAQDYQRGNPDIHIQKACGGFIGLYIEQKKDDSLFYKDTRILKPEHRHIWQALYHADLREAGYWVMFSISLEATKKMTERYMAGNPYTMQIFDYKCKEVDAPIFATHKHFKPVELI
jgi:hypothetical protein